MKLLFLASELDELEKTLRAFENKFNEMYIYIQFTFYLLLSFIILKFLSKLINLGTCNTSTNTQNEIKELKKEIEELKKNKTGD